MMKQLIVTAASWLLVVVAAARCSADDRAPSCTRLPLTVRPTKYDVHLKFASSADSDEYEGQVDIAIDFPLAKEKRRSLKDLSAKPEFAELIRGFASDKELCEGDYILLHAAWNIEIRRLQVLRESYLKFLSNDKMKERKIAKMMRDKASDQLAIKLAHGLTPSKVNVISIAFAGRMRQDKRGIYLSTYNEGMKTYRHIVSQFQPTDARTAFPCFDEPRFKVPFSLSVTHDSRLTAYGNTEAEDVAKSGDGLMNTRFATTPDMPIHMLAFVIGQFDKLESTVNGVQVRVLTAPGKRESGHFALQVAMDSLAYFEKYIDYKFPLKKLDVVAIADHDKDNTESWGLVFVRDTLLWIDEETKEDTKITTAVNVAHVVVHQWFGNLISVAWWSDLWITEGVAAQFAFKIVQERYAFQSEYFVRLAILSGVMQSDQPGKLHTLSPPRDELQTSDQIYGLFDNLEFMKSGSMAEMMFELMKQGRYREGLRRLVKRRAYKTITVDDYLEALLDGRSPLDNPYITGLIDTFTKFKGVPLINLTAFESIKRLCYIIEPFATARKSFADERWTAEDIKLLMPLVYGTGPSDMQEIAKVDMQVVGFDYVTKKADCLDIVGILKEPTGFVKLSPNPSIATYFRTRYSDALLDRLKLAIQNKWISPMDRLQLLDDHNQLALAGLMPAETFGQFVEAYSQEDDNAVLIAMLAASKTLVDLKQTESAASVQRVLVRVFETYGFQVAGDESFLLQRLRSVVLKAFITQGNQQVIEAAVKAFEEANGEVALFLREPVYTAIVVSGSSQVEKLVAKLDKTKSYEEQMRLVAALSLSKNKQVLAKTLNLIQWSSLKEIVVKPYVDTIKATLDSLPFRSS